MFAKLDNGTVLEAPTFVAGPGFELLADQHEAYIYPVEGWYWFDTREEAYTFFGVPLPV